jgi:tetratricopeptide (TPR) repeat protein
MYAEVVDGINLIWDNKFEEAEKLFTTKSNTHPRHALHHAEVAFLRSFITADSSDTDAAVARLKHAKNLAELQLKLYEKGTTPPGLPAMDKAGTANMLLDTRVVMGDVLYMLAVLQLTRDSKLKGAFNMRKSWKVFEESLKMVSTDKSGVYEEELVRCLNFGAGFFFFAMSIIPQKFLKLIELVGFKADRDLGLKYIRECHDAGGVRAPFASIVLLFNNLILPRGLANPSKYLKEADSLIQQSLVKYPNGSLFQVMGSHCARKQCNVDEGIRYMEAAIENCKSLGVAPLIYKYELANCFCMKLKWDVAAAQFEPLVETEKFQVRALCALQLAGCYLMAGQRDKAMALLQRVPSLIKKNSSVDPIVAAQAQRHLASGAHFLAFEMLYIRRDLAKMENEMPDLLVVLEQVAAQAGANKPLAAETTKGGNGFLSSKFRSLSLGNKPNELVDYSADNRGAYLMIKGAMLRTLNKPDEALACFKEVISMDNVLREKYFVPYSYFELAEALYHNNQLKEAQDVIKKCNNISGYAWEDPLKVRLRVTMDQLKKGGVLDDADLNGADTVVEHSSSN